jgi:hypothetical protein
MWPLSNAEVTAGYTTMDRGGATLYAVKRRHLRSVFFSPEGGGGSSTQAWMPTYISILRIPQMI